MIMSTDCRENENLLALKINLASVLYNKLCFPIKCVNFFTKLSVKYVELHMNSNEVDYFYNESQEFITLVYVCHID